MFCTEIVGAHRPQPPPQGQTFVQAGSVDTHCEMYNVNPPTIGLHTYPKIPQDPTSPKLSNFKYIDKVFSKFKIW